MARRKEPIIPDAIVDQLLAGADPKTIFDPNGLIDDLKKAFAERVLNAEMDHHLDGDEEAGNAEHVRQFAVIAGDHQCARQIPALQCHQKQEPQR